MDCPGTSLLSEPVRLALLAPDRLARDQIVESFNRAGIGASPFYSVDLPTIAGIPEVVTRQGPFLNSNALACRLFTLPTHGLVGARTVESAHNSVLAWHRTPPNRAKQSF